MAGPDTLTARPPGIVPFGWQAGRDGFLCGGMGVPYCHTPPRPWADYFYQAVFGGRYSGKSYIGAARHFLYATAWPGSTNIIAVPNYKTALRGTLPALRKVLADQGYHQGSHYEFNKTDMTLTYKWCGSTVMIVSLDDEDSGRSIRAASAWLDEPGFISFEAFKGIQPTMTEEGFPHQMWLTTTTTGKDQWMYPFFFPREAFEENYSETNLSQYILSESGSPNAARHEVTLIDPDLPDDPPSTRVCMFADTLANPYGGARQWNQMRQLLGEHSAQFKQEARGRFVVLENATYPQWDTEYHARPRAEWPAGCRDPEWRPDVVGIGVDFGKAHKSAVVVKGIDHYGRWFTLETWSKRGTNPAEVAENARRLAEKWGATDCWSDHDPGWRYALVDGLADIDVGCHLANKQYGRLGDPSGGLGTVAAVLGKRVTINGVEEQGCFVDRDLCWDYVREMENYRLPPEVLGRVMSERPLKVNDDLCDADRYVTVGMVRWRLDDPLFGIELDGMKVLATSLIGDR